MLLVDPEVTRLKVERELDLWHAHAETYRKRGWVLLAQRENQVEIGFLGRVQLGAAVVPVAVCCVRIDFTNYDLWAPSVEFIDAVTGEYAPPAVPAVVPTEEGPRNLLVGSHPDTGRPFFCVPGTREYHTHPQHSGDSWLLRRGGGEGSLATLCDRIWRSTARSLIGLEVSLLTLPVGSPDQLKLQLRLATGDIDALQQPAGPTQGEAA